MANPNLRCDRAAKNLSKMVGARLLSTLVLVVTVLPPVAYSLTANKVWFEFHPHRYRVVFQYTVPELKQAREAVAEFKTKKAAEKFYWQLVRGADFFLGDPEQVKFINPPSRPDPW